ncbi:hypothetical protein J6TS2_08730 [Heyndrickxia sporothermodurans]|nr:hypothetical protein J6TS2_08730 [Heyndrickxia sporothermodurans]
MFPLIFLKLPGYAAEESPTIHSINDKDQVIAGKALNQTSIKAYIDDQELSLKSYDEATGYFEFFPSNLLTINKQVRIVFEKNGEELVINKKVLPAPAPNKPLVDPISNKST